MNALSQISQLVAVIGEDKAKWFLQKCIDDLEKCKSMLENPTPDEELKQVICGKCEKLYEECVCPPAKILCKNITCNRPATKKDESSDCWGECSCGYCSHNYYWNLCDVCSAEESGDLCDCGRLPYKKGCSANEDCCCEYERPHLIRYRQDCCCDGEGCEDCEDDDEWCVECGMNIDACLECSNSAEAICIFCCDSEYCVECPKDRQDYRKEEVCGSCCATREKHNDELCDWE
jgi:hypothetical protein